MTSAPAEDWGATQGLLLQELRDLLEEPVEFAVRREPELRTLIETNPEMPIVLFGAGHLGRRALGLLRAHGRSVASIVDNNPSLWGAHVEGVPVMSPAEASGSFAESGLAVVTIWRAEGGHDFRVTRANLNALGWKRVESFIPLFWGYGDEILPHITIERPSRVLGAKTEVMAAALLWSDERSLQEYIGQIRWRLTADFDSLFPPEPAQYFPESLVRLGAEEVFVDCGAYDGDTLREFARRAGTCSAYLAFEPDPGTFARLQAALAALPPGFARRTRLYRAATSDRPGTAHFAATGLESAKITDGGTYEVQCVAIDDVVEGLRPTFIKMDIEGAEAAALAGARKSIVSSRPLLAIAAYHKQADLWELPLQVRDMVHNYRLYLRPHAAEGFETILYAIPEERGRGS